MPTPGRGPDGAVVGVLGLGGIGALLAARLTRAGVDVVGIGTERSVRDIGDVLHLEGPDGTADVRPRLVTALDRPVDAVLVAVKAPDLEAAADRVDRALVADGIVVPLLNGLGHVERLRSRFAEVAAGAIGGVSARRSGASVVHDGGRPRVVSGADDAAVRGRLAVLDAPLAAAGIDHDVADSEAAAIWQKLVRIGPVALACAASGTPLGATRDDAHWGGLLRDAVAEACAIAAAAGAGADADAVGAQVGALSPGLVPSLADDIGRGRRGELDALGGRVLEAARDAGIDAPALGALVAAVERRLLA